MRNTVRLNVGKGLADRYAVPIMTAQLRGCNLKHMRPILLRSILIVAFAAVTSAAVTSGPALAQGIKRLGDFGDWSSFQFTENGNKACYMASQPKKAEGKYKKRGDVYAIVTHRPGEKLRDEVSILAGYSYKKDSAVQVTIGKKTFELFTQGDGAWAKDKKADETLVKAMIKGSTMMVKGTSARGTKTTDTFSLKGFTKAYAAIGKACGLKK
jgi:invasion protein IalB